jgi:hypothetical protein
VPQIARAPQVPTTRVGRSAGSQRRGFTQDPPSSSEPTRSAARGQAAATSVKQVAQVATATLLVAGCPVGVVWWLRVSGAVSSVVLAVLLGMVLSLCASFVGCLVWEERTGSDDLLFSELMVWGFLHRWHTQRRLASALDMLGPRRAVDGGVLDGLSTTEQAKLLEQLVAGMETRDPYLHGHSRRVARHSWMIARRMGLPRAQVARIRTAAAIHDVGKINTPKAILHKAGPLTDEEYEVIKRHPGDGAQMAAVLRDPELTSMVRHHHERIDGTGYPDCLSAEEIPLGARIIAVADTFDAITSARPYRHASPHKRAIDILKEDAATRLDPAVVRAFCGHYAGRGPLALWSFVGGLPERVLSWLSASAVTVASAAKVAAVAALVCGAAVTSATLGLPVAKHSSRNAHAARTSALQVRAVHPTSVSAPAPGRAVAMPSARRVVRVQHAAARPSIHGASSAGAAPAVQPTIVGTPGSGGDQSAAPGTRQGPSESANGRTSSGEREETHVNRPDRPGEVKREETATQGKTEEAHAKPEEAPAEVGEAHGKSEEPHGKNEEAHGKSEEAHSKNEEPHGKSEEPHAKSEEAPGKSEEAHGKSEEAHSKSEEARAKREEG